MNQKQQEKNSQKARREDDGSVWIGDTRLLATVSVTPRYSAPALPYGEKPGNFAGSQEAYERSKATEAARARENLEWNLGSGWRSIWDEESESYKPGKSAADGTGRISQLLRGGEDIGSRYDDDDDEPPRAPAAKSGGSAATGGKTGGTAGESGPTLAEQRAEAAREKALREALEEQRERYVRQRQLERVLPEQLAAAGHSGGQSTQTLARSQEAYRAARDEALKELEEEEIARLGAYTKALRAKYEYDRLYGGNSDWTVLFDPSILSRALWQALGGSVQ